MKLDRSGTVRGLLMIAAALAIVLTKDHQGSTGMAASVAPPHKSKRAIRPDSGNSRDSRKQDGKDALPFIRNQFATLLSERPESASLDETLAACARLNSTSAIIDLLHHAELGWKPFAPDSGTGDSSERSVFAGKVHDALFARWGELDFDGAFKRLRTMGRFGYPTNGGGDFDEYWSTTAHLFKGGATIDGKHAFEVLDEMSRSSIYQEIALGPLMEGWAKSDPEDAWEALTSQPSMRNAWKPSIEGYFNGLPSDVSWSEMRLKVETLCSVREVIGDDSAKREFRRSLAKAWGRDDPASALGWYAPQCLTPDSSDGDAPPRTVFGQAEIIANWIKVDPQGATRWLRDWHPAHVSTTAVYGKLGEMTGWDHRGYGSPEMKAAVQSLVRQP